LELYDGLVSLVIPFVIQISSVISSVLYLIFKKIKINKIKKIKKHKNKIKKYY